MLESLSAMQADPTPVARRSNRIAAQLVYGEKKKSLNLCRE